MIPKVWLIKVVISIVFEITEDRDDEWRYRMRPVLREALVAEAVV
jgi:hypothetical protein